MLSNEKKKMRSAINFGAKLRACQYLDPFHSGIHFGVRDCTLVTGD